LDFPRLTKALCVVVKVVVKGFLKGFLKGIRPHGQGLIAIFLVTLSLLASLSLFIRPATLAWLYDTGWFQSINDERFKMTLEASKLKTEAPQGPQIYLLGTSIFRDAIASSFLDALKLEYTVRQFSPGGQSLEEIETLLHFTGTDFEGTVVVPVFRRHFSREAGYVDGKLPIHRYGFAMKDYNGPAIPSVHHDFLFFQNPNFYTYRLGYLPFVIIKGWMLNGEKELAFVVDERIGLDSIIAEIEQHFESNYDQSPLRETNFDCLSRIVHLLKRGKGHKEIILIEMPTAMYADPNIATSEQWQLEEAYLKRIREEAGLLNIHYFDLTQQATLVLTDYRDLYHINKDAAREKIKKVLVPYLLSLANEK